MTTQITVAEARSFIGALSQMAVSVKPDEMAASYAFNAASKAIHNAIAMQHPGVNYGAFSNAQRRYEDTVTIDEEVARAGAWACRKLPGEGDEWPAVSRLID